MLVLLPSPAFQSGLWGSQPSISFSRSGYDLDDLIQQTAHRYAEARADAVRRQLVQEQRARELQQAARREAIVDALRDQQGFQAYHPYTVDKLVQLHGPSSSDVAYHRACDQQIRRRRAIEERERVLSAARIRTELEHRAQAQRRAQAEQQGFNAALLELLYGSPPVAASTSERQEKFIRKPRSKEPMHLHPYGPAQPAAQPSESDSLKERLLSRLRVESDPELRATLAVLLSAVATSQDLPPAAPVDPKGKARETPAIPLPSSSPLPSKRDQEPRKEVRTFTPPADIQSQSQQKSVHFETAPSSTFNESTNARSSSNPSIGAAPSQSEAKNSEGDTLHRAPAVSPALAKKLLEFLHFRRARKVSLTEIQRISEELHALESSFTFPSHLDFTPPSRSPSPTSDTQSESSQLAYTPNNKAIYVYEHALNNLLAKLDAVESGGDPVVRGRRKEVVNEVEKALKDMERKVEESRERVEVAERLATEVGAIVSGAENTTAASELGFEVVRSQPAQSVQIQHVTEPAVGEAAADVVEVSAGEVHSDPNDSTVADPGTQTDTKERDSSNTLHCAYQATSAPATPQSRAAEASPPDVDNNSSSAVDASPVTDAAEAADGPSGRDPHTSCSIATEIDSDTQGLPLSGSGDDQDDKAPPSLGPIFFQVEAQAEHTAKPNPIEAADSVAQPDSGPSPPSRSAFLADAQREVSPVAGTNSVEVQPDTLPPVVEDLATLSSPFLLQTSLSADSEPRKPVPEFDHVSTESSDDDEAVLAHLADEDSGAEGWSEIEA